ncbi:MAG: cation transporter [Dysgonamonadaceae bacterium]|jgi:Cu(I)/Ag(I) efflux system membrane fusion protein|nr:cation transporter [Dysgonamonadaceae bacterium]
MKKLIFLSAVIVLIAVNSGCSGKKQSPDETVSTVSVEETQATLVVQGNCEMCKSNIEKAAQGEEGVGSAEWDGESKELQVRFDAAKTSPDAISKAIAAAGYDTEKDKADDEAYNALAPCCKYR